MMALKIEEGAMSQEKLAASRSWKKETDFPPEASRRMQLCKQLDLSLVKVIANFWPPVL